MRENVTKVAHFALKLQHELVGHKDVITGIVWSNDGNFIATSSKDRTIQTWHTKTGQTQSSYANKGRSGVIADIAWSPDGKELIAGTSTKSLRVWNCKTHKSRSIQGHSASINSVSFSPNGKLRASGSNDKTIRVCNADNGKLRFTLKKHSGQVFTLAWTPDSSFLASGSGDKTIRLWATQNGKCVRTFQGHTDRINRLCFSPDGKFLVSASRDRTIGVWNYNQKRLSHVLEGHTSEITDTSFSFDSRLLASQSTEGEIKLWRTDTWEMVGEVYDSTSNIKTEFGLIFHPHEPLLATLGERGTSVCIWHIDIEALLTQPAIESVRYSNAKVVLLGNTGVGKSGLAHVLSGKRYDENTDSTHGRRVWPFEAEAHQDDLAELREVLLWDLAGQPSYRLIHQLHLNEVAVALIVFDAASDTDPFSGVRYWSRALDEAQRLQGDAALPLQKFLVSARIDRGTVYASSERIDSVVAQLKFNDYFATSAKEGIQVQELANTIKSSIDWDNLPSVRSTELFRKIKKFLVHEKAEGSLFPNIDELFRSFLKQEAILPTDDSLRAQFETCIGRVESQGLVRKLSFGNLVLLQPELLDAYASALVLSAREESNGLGCIAESKARSGNFNMSKDERISDPEQEMLLLLATVEDLLNHEIALREESEDGTYLVFPSQFTRELPKVDPEGKAVTFEFEGSVQNIYSRLAVRLAHSGIFKSHEMWKDAAIFTSHLDSTCGFMLDQCEDGQAELTLFFDDFASEETRFQFEEYVYRYLKKNVIEDSIKKKQLFICPECSTPVTEQQAQKRKERGFTFISCNVCETKVSLMDAKEVLEQSRSSRDSVLESDDSDEEMSESSKIDEMDRAADTQRNRDKATSILEGKIATKDFDVFLCYLESNKNSVRAIGQKLKESGVLPWVDEWNLQPGLSWQRSLERQINDIKSVAVFVDDHSIPWEDREIEAILREFVAKGCPIIPVLLTSKMKPQLPIFLRGRAWTDFNEVDPDPMGQLLWGITGKRDIFIQGNNLDKGNASSSIVLKEMLDTVERHNHKLTEIVKDHMGKNMSSQTNNFYSSVGNIANTNYGTMNTLINQNSKDINQILSTLRNIATSFPEENQEDILMELDDLESDLQNPEKQNSKRFGKRLKRLLAAGAAVSTMVSGAATFSGNVNDFTDNVIELGRKIDIELVQSE